MSSITQSAAWQALQAHQAAFDRLRFRQSMAEDAGRVRDCAISIGGLHADYSRHLASRETLALLMDLARSAQLEDRRRQLFEGALVNNTERRPALHTLLRSGSAHVDPGDRKSTRLNSSHH